MKCQSVMCVACAAGTEPRSWRRCWRFSPSSTCSDLGWPRPLPAWLRPQVSSAPGGGAISEGNPRPRRRQEVIAQFGPIRSQDVVAVVTSLFHGTHEHAAFNRDVVAHESTSCLWLRFCLQRKKTFGFLSTNHSRCARCHSNGC